MGSEFRSTFLSLFLFSRSLFFTAKEKGRERERDRREPYELLEMYVCMYVSACAQLSETDGASRIRDIDRPGRGRGGFSFTVFYSLLGLGVR